MHFFSRQFQIASVFSFLSFSFGCKIVEREVILIVIMLFLMQSIPIQDNGKHVNKTSGQWIEEKPEPCNKLVIVHLSHPICKCPIVDELEVYYQLSICIELVSRNVWIQWLQLHHWMRFAGMCSMPNIERED